MPEETITTAATTTEGTTAAAAATTETGTGTGAETTTTQTTETGTILGTKPGETPAEGTETTKKADEQTEEKDAKATEGAPEKYEFTAPEGMTLDPVALEKFTPLAKKLNLSQEQANEFVGLYGEQIMGLQKAQVEAYNQQVADWGETVTKDKELGGANLPATVQAATSVMDKFGTPEFRALMDLRSEKNPTGLGLGNHPELVRFVARIGKAMAEDTFHTGSGEAEKSLAQKFYPGMNP